MKITFLITLVALIGLSTLAPMVAGANWNNSFVQKPGIIRATIANGVSNVLIPRGGAIIQPVFPLDNSDGALPFTLTVKGQACAVGDPLILMYRPAVVTSPAIVMTLPQPFFNITECGVPATTIDLATRARWVLTFIWDGEKFVAQQDICVV